jgi:hypothetical protein
MSLNLQAATEGNSSAAVGMGPAPEVVAADVTCTLQLPVTSFPKNRIRVLLLENISQTAVELFSSEKFQIVRCTASHTNYSLALVGASPLMQGAWISLDAGHRFEHNFKRIRSLCISCDHGVCCGCRRVLRALWMRQSCRRS